MRILFLALVSAAGISAATALFAQTMPQTSGGTTSGGTAAPTSSTAPTGGSTSDGTAGSSAAAESAGGSTAAQSPATNTQDAQAAPAAPQQNTASDTGGEAAGDEWFDDFPDEGWFFDFQEELRASFKKKKRTKKWLGYLAVGSGRTPLKIPYDPAKMAGGSWRVAKNALDEPLVQGSLAGPGSKIGVRINAYTGETYAQFDGKTSNWAARYYVSQGAVRAEFADTKCALYQEEAIMGEDGADSKLSLLLTGKTVFGAIPEASVFIVDPKAMPESVPACWGRAALPRAALPIVPSERIMEHMSQFFVAMRDSAVRTARAAARALTVSELFNRMGHYERARAHVDALRNTLAFINFDDPNLDYDAIQEHIDAYEAAETRAQAALADTGNARILVRDGAWLYAASDNAYALMRQGVPVPFAILFDYAGKAFDFYVVPDGRKVIVGSCAPAYDEDGQATTRCATRKTSAFEEKSIANRARDWREASMTGNDMVSGVEQALFVGSGAGR
jgi:hypothetical protein